jgi:hypothetical protein
MKQTVYIGVDDTDILGGSFGTGRVAREMATYAEGLGLGYTIGVIRYQLLVDPRIHYTSHNSCKCIEFESDATLPELHLACSTYLTEHFQQGSDPGLCTCAEQQINPELVAYGELAQREFITKEQAKGMAQKHILLLSELGGTGEGIVGALAAVGLRGSGNGGRYVQLRGIKEIRGLVTVSAIMENTAIIAVIDENGLPVSGTEIVDSRDWIKPNVINGKAVLRIQMRKSEGNIRIWETIEQRHKKKEEETVL